MEITTHQEGQVSVLSIVGSVDTLTSEEASTYISQQINQGNLKLVADLSRVDYLSSAGLRVLLGSAKESRSRGGDFRLANAGSQIFNVLEMAGFTSILKHYDSLKEAIASYGG